MAVTAANGGGSILTRSLSRTRPPTEGELPSPNDDDSPATDRGGSVRWEHYDESHANARPFQRPQPGQPI